jgi:hypothetical protein
MKKAWQSIAISIIQLGFHGMIKSLTLYVLCDNTISGFKVIQKWTCQFMKHYINWTFRVTNTPTSKLPSTWQQQDKFVPYCVVYITKVYDIPLSLVIDSDQIGIHLVPTSWKRTWKNKGSKHIQVLGIKDKR